MNKIQIVNILLTRKCNLNCEYCRIVKDIPETSYPNMKYYHINELQPNEWIDIIDKIYNHNNDTFFIIYGGEPFLYKGLWEILKHCNDKNINYTVISNNTDAVQTSIKEVAKKIGGKYRGFTSSVDPLFLMDVADDDDIKKKSELGFKRLCEMKKSGLADDVVAEITVTNQTISYLYPLVEKLSDNNIYSSITVIDDQKNKYYDFSTITDQSLMVQKDSGIKEQFDKIIKNKDKLLVHIPELLTNLYNILPSNGFCGIDKDLHNLTIDADGRIRLCLRIRGFNCTNLSVDDLFDKEHNILSSINGIFKVDYGEYCEGCNWTCTEMSKYYSNQVLEH